MLRVGLFLLTAIAALAEQDTLQDKILAKERQELDCLKTGNYPEFGGLLIRSRRPALPTENNSARRYISRLFGRSAKVSGSAYTARRLKRDNLEI